ncbi:IS701 family transposase [Streptomyces cinereoruber]|uniref:IS701 family transposase n=1 Tax=Streptomyces cinereoruber TaxID=67260 RepID=UPI003C2C0E55
MATLTRQRQAEGPLRPPRDLGEVCGLFAGLLSDVERKNCWSLAEHCGYRRPDAMQRLLRSARWDADAVRDDLRDLVVERLGHPDGVLIVDETGFLKKGEHSAGVQRQYSGTAGRIENSQTGVFLAYASGRGRALIDRRLYLPEESWCDDGPRRAAAGIPEQATFATKPHLARDMVAVVLDAGIPARWVTGDEVYGQDPALRAESEAHGTGYVLTVSCATCVHVNDGRTPVRADTASATLPESAWQTRSAGAGAKGPRAYRWAWIALDGNGSHRQLLVRRNAATGERAFYLCSTPQPTPLSTLVRIAGVRWSIEECFQTVKGQVGLDHYQVRHFTSWHRHITLAMVAFSVLAFLVAEATTTPTGPGCLPIDLTTNEIRHLVNALILDQPCSPAQLLHWSIWRRTHQGRARHSHYQRRHTT